MRLIVTSDPETGMSVEKVSVLMKGMARKFPTLVRICDVPSELWEQYREVEAIRKRVQTALYEVFQSASTSK